MAAWRVLTFFFDFLGEAFFLGGGAKKLLFVSLPSR